MIFRDPNSDARTFNFSDLSNYTAMNKTRELLHPIMDATDPDISDFTRRGGKLLMYHGWADPNIAPTNAINYYESAKQAIGNEAHDSVRLFMVPGMGHCTGGAGFHSIDYLGALEKWVEAGVRPEQSLALTQTPESPARSAPIPKWPSSMAAASTIRANNDRTWRHEADDGRPADIGQFFGVHGGGSPSARGPTAAFWRSRRMQL